MLKNIFNHNIRKSIIIIQKHIGYIYLIFSKYKLQQYNITLKNLKLLLKHEIKLYF